MSIKMIGIALALASTSTACVARSASVRGIALTRETKELAGWFSAKGEWAIFPDRKKSRYNPYAANDSDRCVSLINKTGLPRSGFVQLDRKHVILNGYAVEYDRLSDGDSPGDKLLSKKYLDGEPVENSCLRQLVFVATDIHEKKP